MLLKKKKDAFGDFILVDPEGLPAFARVSVLMSVHNGGELLSRSLSGILRQTFRDLEFIVIDDASDDGSGDVMEQSQRQDSRIRLVRNPERIGLTKSLVRGVALARGEIIARQDADDASVPRRLEKQMSYIPKYDFVCCRTRINGRRVYPKLPTILFYRFFLPFKNVFVHGTFVFKKELLERVGGYDPEIPFAQDYDLMRRIVGVKGRLKYLPDVLYDSTKGRDCISIKKRRSQDACKDRIRKNLKKKKA